MVPALEYYLLIQNAGPIKSDLKELNKIGICEVTKNKKNKKQSLILVVDDEQDILDLLSITLKRMGLKSVTAANLADGKAALHKNEIDLCLTDMRLPDGNGLELVEYMQQHFNKIPVAVITAHGNVEAAVKALKLGAFDFVSKPVDLNWLRQLIQSAINIDAEDSDSDEMQDKRGKPLIGASEVMQKLKTMIRKVSRSQAPVHIRGESGTGKELVARLIHDTGPRADEPFVPVNCGAIPSELMESELFGHKKGSFTGATSDKQGLIQSADGGTLFLDELGDLPLHMQVKLLRVIQEKAVRPVGGNQEINVNVRFLSATHKDLLEKVKEGAFREDLYYRINVIDLTVPPLRDRNNDILLMANFILNRIAEDNNSEALELSDTAKNALLDYHFPGNVRELENILERAVALSDGGQITENDLTLRTKIPETVMDTSASGLHTALQAQERKIIEQALAEHKYNKTKTAKA
ncbi:MAG: sigma-54-dependent Fis family transcriptional regulator, partial [Gammaproteobacteria bacterium]|nr:sigma-54-dependent Fis family transcriptional regulator [Gammaproteobacteria bacterium]